jgi:microcystin degradation protein MlrC
LHAALPVDGVILGLHGAMVAQGCDDCEGDLLERVRAIVGPKVVVAAELDPHSHLTKKRVANADILAAFLEFPHTDFFERAEHVVDLALRAVRGDIRPVMAAFDCRMIDIFPTSREPMRGFVDRLRAKQGENGVLSLSLIHGFMAADVPEMGTQMLAIVDGDCEKAAALARTLGLEIFGLRGRTAMPMLDIDAGLDAALALAARRTGKPAVVADVWDNPGGGVAGDGTLILRRMLERGIENFAVATIWDPVAVFFCLAAGKGAKLQLRFGGKTGPDGGAPIDAMVEVVRAVPESWQSFGAIRVTLGPSALVRLLGTDVEVILNTNRTQTLEPDVFSNLGVDPASKAILLVKSTNHFYAGFAPIAEGIVYIDAGAPSPSHPRQTQYRKLEREIWPRVENPHGL